MLSTKRAQVHDVLVARSIGCNEARPHHGLRLCHLGFGRFALWHTQGGLSHKEPPSMSFLLSDIEAACRQDLFDPASANQRWATSDIDRAIDKSVDRYTIYYPNIAFTDMQTQQYQRT